MTTGRDLYLLLGLIGFVVVSAGAVVLLRRRIIGLLTPREWHVLGKIVGIVVMVFVLYLVQISRGFPPEMFIYGRF